MIIGIDPGQSGGIAYISPRGWAQAAPMPVVGKEIDGRALASILREIREIDPQVAIIEKVASRPRQGVASMFRFGQGYGVIIGVCEALGIPYRLTTPQAWKKVVLAGTAKDKDAAISFVRRAYPGLDLKPGRKRVPHDGMADAVCLAEFGRQLMGRDAA